MEHLQQTLSFIDVSLYSSLINSLVARQTSSLPLSVCLGVKFNNDVETLPLEDTFLSFFLIFFLLNMYDKRKWEKIYQD